MARSPKSKTRADFTPTMLHDHPTHNNAIQLMDEHEWETPSIQDKVHNDDDNESGEIQLIPPIMTLLVAPHMQLEFANKSMVDDPMFYINPLLNKATSQVANLA